MESQLPEMFVRDKEEQPKVSYNEFKDEDIPVISLADHNKARVLEVVRKACSEWGAFQIVDHGIPPHVMKNIVSLSHDFFGLSNEEKLRYHVPGSTSFRVGYFVTGKKMEFRQRFSFQTYPTSERNYSAWPQLPNGWRDSIKSFSEEAMKVTTEILGIISQSLCLDEDALISACRGDLQQNVVMNFYPKCPQPEMALGLRPHTDPAALTLVLQDAVGGLQVTKDDGNSWFTVKPIDGALVVIIGDCLDILSNGQLKKLVHRAVVNNSENRLSIAAFHLPSPYAPMCPLHETMGVGESSLVEQSIPFSEWYRLARETANQAQESSYKPEEILDAITKCSATV